jgi:hypothetical protein
LKVTSSDMVRGDREHERDQAERREHAEDRLDGERGEDVLAHDPRGLARARDRLGEAG